MVDSGVSYRNRNTSLVCSFRLLRKRFRPKYALMIFWILTAAVFINFASLTFRLAAMMSTCLRK